MEKSENKKYVRKKCSTVTPTFRAMFCRIFAAEQVMGKGDKKYSITMSFQKKLKNGKVNDLSALTNIMEEAKNEKWPNKADRPKKITTPIIDGDLEEHEGKEGYVGCWVVKATSNEFSKPDVFDENGEPIMDATNFYSGCYARAQIFARVWEYMGKHGVQFILDGVQKVREGEKFTNKVSSKAAFAATAFEPDEDTEKDDGDNVDFEPMQARRSSFM